MKKLILISILTLLPIVSFAAIDIQKQNDRVTLTTAKNTYIAGNLVNIFQEKSGDVYAASNIVSVTGKVGQDLVAVAGNINITSEIGGDLRVVTGNINLTGPVDGELFAAAGQLEIAPSSVIKGDFFIAGGKVNIDGLMNGNGKIFGNEVHISGVLNKDVNIKAKKLVIEKTAVINGNIDYQGNEETVVKDGAKINGKITFAKIEVPKIAKRTGIAAVFTLFWLIKILAALAASLILFFLLKRNIPKILGETMGNFWKELLRGFVILIVIPVAIMLLFITIIGSVLSVFGIALYVLLSILAAAFSGILIAELLNRLIFRGPRAKPLNWLMVILGVIVMGLLVFVPIVGWIVDFVIFLVALGAISNLIFHKAKTLAE